jgi:hypothetical protein
MSYKPRTSIRIGGIFISADGSQRVIPDHWLNNAELTNDSTLLRLSYSTHGIEISGKQLNGIFNDIIIGKIGTIALDDPNAAPESGPSVTSIVYLPAPFASSAQERSDA